MLVAISPWMFHNCANFSQYLFVYTRVVEMCVTPPRACEKYGKASYK